MERNRHRREARERAEKIKRIKELLSRVRSCLWSTIIFPFTGFRNDTSQTAPILQSHISDVEDLKQVVAAEKSPLLWGK
jgi:hypothetical protein